jgi:hypothetical protein
MISAKLGRVNAPIENPNLARVRILARVLDTAIRIPGTNFRFGLDPIIGLIPGLGDLASAVLSGYVILTGVRLGAPRSVIARMIANVAMDTVVGTVPVVGDLFDASWKSNQRNVALLERHAGVEAKARPSSRLALAGTVIVLVLVALGGVALAVSLVRWIGNALH